MKIYTVRHVGYVIEDEDGNEIGSHGLKTIATGEAKKIAREFADDGEDAEVQVLKDSGGIEKKYFYAGAEIAELHGSSEPNTGETTDEDLDAARDAASDPLK